VLTYKMAIALRPQICDVTSPYVYPGAWSMSKCGERQRHTDRQTDHTDKQRRAWPIYISRRPALTQNV